MMYYICVLKLAITLLLIICKYLVDPAFACNFPLLVSMPSQQIFRLLWCHSWCTFLILRPLPHGAASAGVHLLSVECFRWPPLSRRMVGLCALRLCRGDTDAAYFPLWAVGCKWTACLFTPNYNLIRSTRQMRKGSLSLLFLADRVGCWQVEMDTLHPPFHRGDCRFQSGLSEKTDRWTQSVR